MELERRDGRWCNGQREELQIEDEIVFPLVKSSMFKTPIISDFSKYVIVTQRRVGEDTHILAERTPRIWRYLNRNIRLFEQRRSAIYRGAPPFAMFGVGEYSYCPYKVGVSGFYKRPLFSMLYSKDSKPVMIDDTGYFIGFDEYDLAYVAMLVLNSSPVQHFLSTVAFSDAKRPYTKRVLKRISIQQAVCRTEVGMLAETERQLGLSSYVTADMYERFKALCQRMAEGAGAPPAALK